MKNILILTAIAIALVACGGENKKAGNDTATTKNYEFTINAIGNTMTDMTYDTKELKVKAGSKVVINLVNQGTDGAMLHNLVIVKQNSEKEVAMEGLNYKEDGYFNIQNTNVIAGSTVANPGETIVMEFTAPEPGTYTYICTYPGHWMKMQGILTVD